MSLFDGIAVKPAQAPQPQDESKWPKDSKGVAIPPEKRQGVISEEIIKFGQLGLGGILVFVFAFAVATQLYLQNINVVVLLAIFVAVGIGLGRVWAFCANDINWVRIQRLVFHQNVGKIYIISKAGTAMGFTVNYSKDFAEINTTVEPQVYWLSKPGFKPIGFTGVPCLFFFQGNSEPIAWEIGIGALKDNAGFNEMILMKERGIAQANAILSFKDELLKKLNLNSLLVIISIFITIALGVLVYFILNNQNSIIAVQAGAVQNCLTHFGLNVTG